VLRQDDGWHFSQHLEDTLSNALLIADHMPGVLTKESVTGMLLAVQHDVFGNPFRPVTLAAIHKTPTVVSHARAAYYERHLPSGELDPHTAWPPMRWKKPGRLAKWWSISALPALTSGAAGPWTSFST
jgi:hypothetical protein